MLSQVGQEKQDIIMAGARALVSLYGGAKEEGLYTVQCRWLCERNCNGSWYVESLTLPSTSATEMYYNIRVNYHNYQIIIMYWKGKGANMKQDEWRLYILYGKCLPMQTQPD